MSRRRNKQIQRRKKRGAPPRFAPGSRVRVRAGVIDQEYRDIPLGGWIGTVREVDDSARPFACLVEWDAQTLDLIHPVVRVRYERDGFDLEAGWMDESDLEPETGAPVIIEQPAQIRPRPLQINDPGDRLRAVFGLTSDDPLPEVSAESLRIVHRHLQARLTIPFSARIATLAGPIVSLRVVGLLDSAQADLDDGLLCRAIDQGRTVVVPLVQFIDFGPPGVSQVFLEDYVSWFCDNAREDGNADDSDGPKFAAKPPTSMRQGLMACGGLSVMGGFLGSILGAVMVCVDEGLVAVKIGAVLMGVLLALLGYFGTPRSLRSTICPGALRNGVFGAVLGAALGGMLAALVMTFAGAAIGVLAGGVAGFLLDCWLKNTHFTRLFGMLGALAGSLVHTWRLDSDLAWAGIWQGGLAGAVGLPLLVFLYSLADLWVTRNRD